MIVSALSFAPLYTLKELVVGQDAIVQQTVGTAFDMWQKLAFTLVLIASFVLLYQKQEVQRRGWQSAFLWKDESYELYKPVYNRIGHLFPVRSLSCSLLRICGEFVDWSFHVPAASMVLQMVAVQYKQGPLERVWHKWTWMGTDKR